MVRDDNGVHVFDDEANFSHSLDLPRNIKIYGVLPVRTNGGMLGIFAQMGMTYKLFFFNMSQMLFCIYVLLNSL